MHATPLGQKVMAWVQATPRRPRWVRMGLCVLSGVLFSFASPDYSIFVVSLVCWAPLLVALSRRGWGAALGYGTLTGAVAVLISYGWMVELTGRFGGLPIYLSWLVHILFSAFHGLQWGLAAMLAVMLSQGHSARVPWLFALTWPCMELFFPALFPVNGGFFWADHPSWIQSAEFGGAPMVAGLHVLCNIVLLRVLLASRKVELARRLGVAAALLLLIPGLGMWRMTAMDAQMATYPQLSVGVVQSNAGIDTRRDLRVKVLASLQATSAKLEAKGAELLVWGETVYPFRGFYRHAKVDYPESDPRQVKRGFDVPLLFGLTTYDQDSSWRRPYNTAWILERGGKLGERYDKAKPLWFGEYVPLVNPDWYLDTFQNASYLTRGPGPSVITWDKVRMGPMICYEILLSDYVRETVDKGVNFLVNITNDSWFGATREQGEHLALTVVRAVESRRPLVRSVSAGISAYIDAQGRIIDYLPRTDSDNDGYPGAQGFLVSVPLVDPQARTLFVRVGWAWKLIYPVCTLLLAYAFHRRHRPSGT